ncbi:hypothetical protein ACFZAG_14455 [Streptomyces sp. NPDC012403]|uniref:hypothetical protein n=1 Tax=unclassified Streptomyces TaxID=2593676 RepID=UPI003454BFA0
MTSRAVKIARSIRGGSREAATALHGPGRRGEAKAAVREVLTDCEKFLHVTP